MEEEIKQIMSDIFDLDPEGIDESTTQENTWSWDSLNHINLVAALEQEFELSFSPEEIESMISFIDILEILEGKRPF
jgi:acyl carrier protein